MSSSDTIGPEPLLRGKKELWFVIYDPQTGEIRSHGNAYGEEEYALETAPFSSPNLRVPARIDPIRDYRVNVTTLAVEKYVEPAPAMTTTDVNRERDRRISMGFMFEGKMYQADEKSLKNINGALTVASIAFMDGALANSLRWYDPDKDFGWIASDNTMVMMDAFTMSRLGKAANAWVTAVTMAGRVIKARMAAGEVLDIGKDSLWPSQQG